MEGPGNVLDLNHFQKVCTGLTRRSMLKELRNRARKLQAGRERDQAAQG